MRTAQEHREKLSEVSRYAKAGIAGPGEVMERLGVNPDAIYEAHYFLWKEFVQDFSGEDPRVIPMTMATLAYLAGILDGREERATEDDPK